MPGLSHPFLAGIVVGAVAVGLFGCAGGDKSVSRQEEKDRAIDPRPEKVNGSESRAFEQQDLDRARNAGRLVQIYCSGSESEAQYEGCLSHVFPGDVCAGDTAARRSAVNEYVRQTGDASVCD